ncbi:hypothetical protein AJ80_00332 [Polytolypa hystricis UAMH7299]|uniref:Uncharacterized protein n=1 Tax=Polytolypa hystricis (strain UAMH7299) TaxID=1447883 RepID=A0A2B7Z2C4_POLH7|nr:hypothetical protein AJ80_00332 [Polytolypa hystricis UAMH7299]
MHRQIVLCLALVAQSSIFAQAANAPGNAFPFASSFSDISKLHQRDDESDAAAAYEKCGDLNLSTVLTKGTVCYPAIEQSVKCTYDKSMEEFADWIKEENGGEMPAIIVQNDEQSCYCDSDYFDEAKKCMDCLRDNGAKDGVDFNDFGDPKAYSSAYCAPSQTVPLDQFTAAAATSTGAAMPTGVDRARLVEIVGAGMAAAMLL